MSELVPCFECEQGSNPRVVCLDCRARREMVESASRENARQAKIETDRIATLESDRAALLAVARAAFRFLAGGGHRFDRETLQSTVDALDAPLRGEVEG